jgi:hypothetical protein
MIIYGKAIRHKTLKKVALSALAILILLGASSMASEMNKAGQPYGQQPSLLDYDGVNPGLDKQCLKYEDCPEWDGDLDTKVYYDLMKLDNGSGIIAKSDFNWNVHLYLCHQNELLDSINGKGTFEILAKASAEAGMIPCPIGVNPHWSYDWESHILRAKLKRLTMLWQKDFQGPTGRAGYKQNSIGKVE